MLRQRILEMKSIDQGFYTETYNIVNVLSRLSPDAPPQIKKRLAIMYRKPSDDHDMSLAQLEQLYFVYRDDPNLQIKARTKIDQYDIKRVLDKVRRDLLFFLALLEENPKSYDISEE